MTQQISKSETKTTEDDDVIIINNLTKYYGPTLGVKNLSLTIKKGEIFGYLGRNGAGKTTTIRCILSILIPDEGEIKVNGHTVSRDNLQYKEDIGYLPGELYIPGDYKVKDFLNYIASLRARPSDRMDELIQRFDVPVKKRFNELSKGNKQKVGIVLALMSDPKFLILDEPTAGLDPLYQQDIYELLLEEKKKGKTIFFSSHNLDETQKLCDRVGIIREGKLESIEMVKKLSEKITRVMNITASELTEENISNLKAMDLTVREYDIGLNTVKIAVQNPTEIEKLLNKVKQEIQVVDMAFPPASLEEYFLSKYEK